MKTIMMLLYGDRYNYDDVNRVVASTQSRYSYLLYTDNHEKLRKEGLYPEVDTISIDSEWGTFNKIVMFDSDRFQECLYLDLDVIIQHPDLDDFFVWGNNKPAICKTYWKPEGFEADHGGGDFNSSVMSWNISGADEIYKHFMKDPEYWITKYKGQDDKYLFHEHKDKFMTYPKGDIYSYMFGIDHETDESPRGKKYRPEPSICLLNGQQHFDYDLRTDYYTHFSNNKMG